jgi:hypothetical protein
MCVITVSYVVFVSSLEKNAVFVEVSIIVGENVKRSIGGSIRLFV